MHFDKVALIGVGLLGGSLGLALKERNMAGDIHGFVRRESSIAEAIKVKAVDKASQNLAETVTDADLIVLSTPISQMEGLLRQAVPNIKAGAIITDVGSVKGTVVRQCAPLAEAAKAYFVGSHPMAGAEKIGVLHSRGNLFNKSICVITPVPGVPEKITRCVQDMWKEVGARTIQVSPENHDDFVSRCSHLPHVIAAELANYVLSPVHPKEQSLLCATGFRDTTRIASGSTEMWRDIAMANRKNLSRVLGVFIEDLQEFQLALENNDVKTIEEFFASAKQRRDNWVQASTAATE